MFCVHCGANLEDGARFCTSCGKSLDEGRTQAMPVGTAQRFSRNSAGNANAAWQPVTQQPAQARYGYPGAAQETSSRGPVIALVVAAALVAIAAVVVLFVIRPFDPVNSSTVSGASVTSAQQAQKSGQASSAAAPNTLLKDDSSGAASTAADGSTASTQKSASATSAQKSGDYLIADSNSRYLSRSEVQNMSLYDLYLARNEIYARHGRAFKNQDLRDYFGKKSWYHERYSPEQFDKMDLLNEYEKKNADLMLAVEKGRNSPYV